MPALTPRFGTAFAPLWMACCVTLLSACGASTPEIAEPEPPKPIAAPQVSQWSSADDLPDLPQPGRDGGCAEVRATTAHPIPIKPCPAVTVRLQDGSLLSLSGAPREMTAHVGGQRLANLSVGLRQVDNDGAPWLFAAPNGQVLQGGPGSNLHWIDPRGGGKLALAGPRGGEAGGTGDVEVMFDSGRILTLGGPASVIDVNAGISMHPLATTPPAGQLRDAVVLPSGEVLVIADRAALWNPKSERFTNLPAFDGTEADRVTTQLLPDGRVLTATCSSDCGAPRILTPHYLLSSDGSAAERPVITAAPKRATHGSRIVVSTDSPVDQFVLLRTSTTDAPADHEQRRIPLSFSRIDETDYSLGLAANPGVMLPGDYLLFALNAVGVPSVATPLHVGPQAAPSLINPGPQVSRANTPLRLTTQATTPAGSLSFAATGLPPGLAIDPATGVISGTPSKAGQYAVELSASNGTATTATSLAWSVEDAGTRAAWVRLETRSATNDEVPVAVDSFDLLGRDGALISRDGWQAAPGADTARVVRAVAAIGSALMPRVEPTGLTVELGERQAIAGFRLARRAGSLAVARWRFFTSDDGAQWALAAEGQFRRTGASPAEQTVLLNRRPTLAPLADISTRQGQSASLAVTGNDPDGDALHYSADGLPRGLDIDAATGLISGAPLDAGTGTVTVHVSDGYHLPAASSFEWHVSGTALLIEPVIATPQPAGSSVGFMVRSSAAAVRYRWRFGDGSAELPAGSATMVSHVYAAPGVYTVTVSATDASGQRQRLSFLQAVYAKPAAAGASATAGISARHPTGAYLFVAPAGEHCVAVLDALRHVELYRFDAGRNVDGLAVSPDGLRLYARHAADRTTSVFDLAQLVNYGELNVRLMAAATPATRP